MILSVSRHRHVTLDFVSLNKRRISDRIIPNRTPTYYSVHVPIFRHEPSFSFTRQLIRRSNCVIFNVHRAAFSDSNVRHVNQSTTSLQLYSLSPEKLQTLAFTSESLSLESPVPLNQWRSRTYNFIKNYEKAALDKSKASSLECTPTLQDSQWWNELQEIITILHPTRVTESSLSLSVDLLFNVAIPEYQLQKNALSTSTRNSKTQDDKETQLQEQHDSTSSLIIVRSLLNDTLHKIRVGYKKELKINIILRLYDTSEMWAELQRLEEIPDVQSFTTLLSAVVWESTQEENLTASLTQNTIRQRLDPLSVLKYMLQRNNVDQKPNHLTWSEAANVWAKRARYNCKKHIDAPYRNLQILSFMQSKSLQPDNRTIANVLDSWANSKPNDHVDVAEATKQIFDRYYTDICWTCAMCHFHVIRAYCYAKKPSGADMANTILLKMINNYIKCHDEQQRSEGDSTTASDGTGQPVVAGKPSQHTFHLVMNALLKEGADPKKISFLLRQAQHIDQISNANVTGDGIIENHDSRIPVMFLKFMREYSRRKCPEYAEKLLMEIFNTVINDVSIPKNSSANHAFNLSSSLVFNTDLVNACMNCWATSGHNVAPERAENMLQQYFLDKDSFLSPNKISFNVVMKAWARSNRPDAPDQCEALLGQLWKIYDNSHVSATRLDDTRIDFGIELSKDGHENKLSQNYMTTNEQFQKSIKPDLHSYTTVMRAWSYAAKNLDLRAPDRAEAIYRDMLQRGLKPDHKIFNNLLEIVTFDASTKVPNLEVTFYEKAAKKSSQLLNEMKEKYSFKPHPMSYVLCIRFFLRFCSCSSQNDKMSAYQNAKNVFQEMLIQYPNTNTFRFIASEIGERNGRTLKPIQTEYHIRNCSDAFRYLIKTLKHCSTSSDIDISQELSSIESMMRSTGHYSIRIHDHILKFRTMISTNRDQEKDETRSDDHDQ